MSTSAISDDFVSSKKDSNLELPKHPYFTRKVKKLLQYKLLNGSNSELYVDLSGSRVHLWKSIKEEEEEKEIDVTNFEEKYSGTVNVFAFDNCSQCSSKMLSLEILILLLKIVGSLILFGLVAYSIPHFFSTGYYERNNIRSGLEQLENQINTIKAELHTLKNYESKTGNKLLEIEELLESVKRKTWK